MAFSSKAQLEAKVVFSPDPSDSTKVYLPAEIADIIDHLWAIYSAAAAPSEDGPAGQKLIDDWFTANPTGQIEFVYIQYAAGAYPGTGKVVLDMQYQVNRSPLLYLDKQGVAVAHTMRSIIAHELGHALGGYEDNWNATLDDFSGNNVTAVNKIFLQLNIPEQLSYPAQGREPVLESGRDYSDGNTIDRAFVAGNENLYSAGGGDNFTSAGVNRDLLIGNSQANEFRGGSGNDLIYGQSGEDDLYGDGGADKMFGGSGADVMYGGEESDELYGHEKATGTDVPSDDSASDVIYGEGGEDIIAGGGGDDFLYGGSGGETFREADDNGNDLIHGGDESNPGSLGSADGVDTVDYIASVETRIVYVEDAADPHRAVVAQVREVGFLLPTGVDTLISIENVVGTNNNDAFLVRTNDIENRYDGAGQTGSFPDAEFGDSISYRDNTSGIIVSPADFFANSTHFVRAASNGPKVYDTLVGFERIELTAFDDQISSRTNFLTIEAGAGEDRISARGAGSIVYGGADKDTFILSGQLTLIADAEPIDQIVFGGRVLTGALGSSRAAEKGSVYSFAQGVSYSFSEADELIIQGVGGQTLYVAGADVGPDAKSRTAGLLVGALEWNAYQILDPAYRGGKAYIDGLVEVMDAIRALYFGEDPPGSDPLVLDLDGDGLELSARSSRSPLFDIDGDGFAERSGWTFGGDGFLAIDANGDGLINDVTELFGDATTSGFAELTTHDTNADGVINASDAVFSTLKVWRDSNSNGVTDTGELLALSVFNIESITLPATQSQPVIQAGNTVTATSTYTLTGGVTRAVGDVVFSVDQINTVFLGDTSISATAAALPELKGYGELPSLRIAATLAPSLVPIIQNAAANADTVDLVELAQNIRPVLTAWAAGDYTVQGAGPEPSEIPNPIYYQYTVNESGEIEVARYIYAAVKTVGDRVISYYKSSAGSISTADPTSDPTFAEALSWLESQAASAGGYVSTFGGAQAEALERFSGADVPFEQIFGDPAVGPVNVYGLDQLNGDQREAVRQYIEAYASFEIKAGVALAVQTGLADFFPGVSYDSADGAFIAATPGNLKAPYLAILADAPTNALGAVNYLEGWSPLLKVFLSQFDRGAEHLVNSYSYQFGNLVNGYEALGSFPVSIVQAAAALGIPGVFQGVGTTGADIVYVSDGNETVRGGKGLDSYVFGGNFGDVIVDDFEAVGESGAAPDSLRFAVHDSTQVAARRVGNDLILDFAATGQSVTVQDQFLRERFSATGTRLDHDRGVAEIIFADGVVWDEVDIAKAVSDPKAENQNIVGTRHFDWLNGGAGNDLLQGGNSTDIYVFGSGYGNDTIHEFGPGLTADNGLFILLEGDDFVRFAEGLTFEDIKFSRIGASPDLIITVVATGDTLTIKDQFQAYNTGPFGVLWYDRVEMFSFDEDGLLLTWEDVLREVTLSTTGNDDIHGFYYKDELDGGAGNDFLSGGDDSDTYYFGRGDGSDTIEERQGNVLTSSVDTVVFKAGVAVADVIFVRDGATNDLLVKISGTTDQLRIVDQYTITETGPFGTQAFDQVEVFKWADGTVLNWADMRQGLIDAASSTGNDTIYGTHFNDVFSDGGGNDRLEGGNGSDRYVFAAGDGQNIVLENASNAFAPDDDRVVFEGIAPTEVTLAREGVNSNDLRLTHTASGTSILIQQQFAYTTLANVRAHEVESFEFGGGEVWSAQDMRVAWIARSSTSGADSITGFWSDDTITGGQGNDTLAGGDGSDIYRVGLGDGSDIIRESVGNVAYDDEDVLEFGPGLAATAAIFTRSGNDLIVSFSGAANQIKIEGQFNPSAYFGSWADIEAFKFDGGVTLTDVDIRTRIVEAQTTTGADNILGFFSADTLIGGLGNDTLRGSTGGDTYIYNLGDGNDLIIDTVEHHLFLDNPDKILFGSTITRSNVTFSLSGNDLLVSIAGGGSIRIQNHASNTNNRVELFQFANGTLLTAEEAQANAINGQATAGNDTITGTNSADTLQGGLGNDLLHGRVGGDTYIFNRGDGQDTIDDNGSLSGTDRLIIKGYAPENLNLARGGTNGADLIITFDESTDQVTIKNTLEDHLSDQIEQLQFNDGTAWTIADVRSRMIAEQITAGDNAIVGFKFTDTIEAGLGNDSIQGMDGADTYVFNRGDGQDVIEDNGYLDTDRLVIEGYRSTEAILTRTGTNGLDLAITFAGGSDQVILRNTLEENLYDGIEQVKFEDDQVIWTMADVRVRFLTAIATDGNDSIEGFNAVDTLEGRFGNDTLHGRDGSDTYLFTRGDGQDVIEDNGYFDTDKVMLRGYTPADVILARGTQSPDDLVITFVGTEDRIVIRNTLDDDIYDEVEQIAFENGTVWTMADIVAMIDNSLPPLIFDFNGNGQYISSDDAAFDFEGDGTLERGAWIERGDGFLALDRNGDGQITSGREISFVSDMPGARTDLEGLSAFDTDGDGLLTESDTAFGDFRVWIDANGNGASEFGELSNLMSFGIEVIDLVGGRFTGQQPEGATVLGLTSAYRQDGTSIRLADTLLRFGNEQISVQPLAPQGKSGSSVYVYEGAGADFDQPPVPQGKTRGSLSVYEQAGPDPDMLASLPSEPIRIHVDELSLKSVVQVYTGPAVDPDTDGSLSIAQPIASSSTIPFVPDAEAWFARGTHRLEHRADFARLIAEDQFDFSLLQRGRWNQTEHNADAFSVEARRPGPISSTVLAHSSLPFGDAGAEIRREFVDDEGDHRVLTDRALSPTFDQQFDWL